MEYEPILALFQVFEPLFGNQDLDPDPHQGEKLDPDSHQIKIRIRIRIRVISRIRIRIGIRIKVMRIHKTYSDIIYCTYRYTEIS
jgi:hypothetical protein